MQEPAIGKYDHRGRCEIDVPAHRVLDQSRSVPLHAGHIQYLFARFEKLAQRRLQLLDQNGGFLGDRLAARAFVIAAENVLAKLQRAVLNDLRPHVLVDRSIVWEHWGESPGRAFYRQKKLPLSAQCGWSTPR